VILQEPHELGCLAFGAFGAAVGQDLGQARTKLGLLHDGQGTAGGAG
jgi:hypothetical protein